MQLCHVLRCTVFSDESLSILQICIYRICVAEVLSVPEIFLLYFQIDIEPGVLLEVDSKLSFYKQSRFLYPIMPDECGSRLSIVRLLGYMTCLIRKTTKSFRQSYMCIEYGMSPLQYTKCHSATTC